jgi:hypothetical protein
VSASHIDSGISRAIRWSSTRSTSNSRFEVETIPSEARDMTKVASDTVVSGPSAMKSVLSIRMGNRNAKITAKKRREPRCLRQAILVLHLIVKGYKGKVIAILPDD